MALSSLIHQLPCGKYSAGADGTILESSQQCECGPNGFNLFGVQWACFGYLRWEENLKCTLRLAHSHLEIHTMVVSYLVEKN